MSLKNVHVAFIGAAVLLALFCAAQAFGSYRGNGSILSAVATAAAVSTGPAVATRVVFFVAVAG